MSYILRPVAQDPVRCGRNGYTKVLVQLHVAGDELPEPEFVYSERLETRNVKEILKRWNSVTQR